MKNIQIISASLDCTYDIYSVSKDIFNLLFQNGTDIAFIEDILERTCSAELEASFKELTSSKINKQDAKGIHGILYYESKIKKQFYKERKDELAKNGEHGNTIHLDIYGPLDAQPHNDGRPQKNIQVIDSAINCAYDIHPVTNAQFEAIFPNGTDIAFIEDLIERYDKSKLNQIFENMWDHRMVKSCAKGIHGTLFYENAIKMHFFPTRKSSEFSIPSWYKCVHRQPFPGTKN